MNLAEFAQKLGTLAETTKDRIAEAVIVPEASRMTAEIINRNVQRGENTDGSKRTGYSTKPMYATREQFITKSFTPKGKNSNSPTFQNGKQRKSQYLPEGYKQLREVQGRETSFKNYEYTGDTINAFGFAKTDNGAVIGFRTEKSSNIRKGLEERFGRAFPPSQFEIRQYRENITDKVKGLQVQILTT